MVSEIEYFSTCTYNHTRPFIFVQISIRPIDCDCAIRHSHKTTTQGHAVQHAASMRRIRQYIFFGECFTTSDVQPVRRCTLPPSHRGLSWAVRPTVMDTKPPTTMSSSTKVAGGRFQTSTASWLQSSGPAGSCRDLVRRRRLCSVRTSMPSTEGLRRTRSRCRRNRYSNWPRALCQAYTLTVADAADRNAAVHWEACIHRRKLPNPVDRLAVQSAGRHHRIQNEDSSRRPSASTSARSSVTTLLLGDWNITSRGANSFQWDLLVRIRQ